MKNTTKAKATSSLLPMSWENIHPLPRFYLSKWRFNLTMEVPHSIECTFPDSRTSWEKIVNWSQARLDPHSLVLSGGNNESESRDKNGPRHWFNNNNIVQQKNKFAATYLKASNGNTRQLNQKGGFLLDHSVFDQFSTFQNIKETMVWLMRFYLTSISYQNEFHCRVTSDWLKLVMWLEASNHSALQHQKVVMRSWNLFVTSTPADTKVKCKSVRETEWYNR